MELFKVNMHHRREEWVREITVAGIPRSGDTVVENYDSSVYERVYTVCHVEYVVNPEDYGSCYVSARIWVEDEIVAE